MIINGIICELNPMHLGHKYVFDTAKEKSLENSINIAVMSGNFTQRCTPAIYDKYVRAKAAVECGADIVVELPFTWCSSGVESFALGGVAVAAGLGAQRLVFGSETGDTELLSKVSKIKASDEFLSAIIDAEESGRDKGSAVIFDDVMKSLGVETTLGANDKLGLEYMRFGKEYGISEFYPTPRLKSLKSATDLRKLIFENGLSSCKDYIPTEAYDTFAESPICTEDKYSEILFNHCRLYSDGEQSDILAYASKVAKEQDCAERFIQNLPTKKYTLARLRREILFSLIAASPDKTPPLYTVLLAMSQKGREYLSENKKKISFQIITKPSDTDKLDARVRVQYKLNQKADELYALCSGKPASEYIKKHPHVL